MYNKINFKKMFRKILVRYYYFYYTSIITNILNNSTTELLGTKLDT